MRLIHPSKVMLCVAAATLLAAARGGLADDRSQFDAALDLLPADAVAAVIVPRCSATSEQLGRVNEILGLRVPELVDVLGELKQRSGLRKGFRNDGTAIFIVRGPFAMAAAVPGVALLPVDDFGRFTADFQVETVEGVSRLEMPDGRAPFAKPIPGYAVVGADRQSVASYQPPRTAGVWKKMLGPLGTIRLRESDFGVIINVEKVAPVLQPLVTQALRFQLDNNVLISQEQRAACAAMFGMAGDSIAAFLRDTQAIGLALDLQKGGVALSVTAQFRPDSPLAGLFHGKGTAAPELLANLPDDPYLMAAAANTNGFSLQKLLPPLLERLPAAMGGIEKLLPHQRKLVAQLRGQAMVIYGDRPQEPGGEAAMKFAAALEVADSKAYVEAIREYLEAFDGQTLPLMPGGEVTVTCSYRPNERVVGGIQCDRYEVRYAYPEGYEQQIGPWADFMKLMGMEGAAGYIAAVDEHRIVQTNTTDAQLISKLVAAARTQRGLGTQGPIREAREVVSGPAAALEMFLSVADILRFAEPWIGAQPGPNQGAGQLAESRPVAIRGELEGDAAAGRVFVPMGVLHRIRQMVAPQEGNQFGGPGQMPYGR